MDRVTMVKAEYQMENLLEPGIPAIYQQSLSRAYPCIFTESLAVIPNTAEEPEATTAAAEPIVLPFWTC